MTNHTTKNTTGFATVFLIVVGFLVITVVTGIAFGLQIDNFAQFSFRQQSQQSHAGEVGQCKYNANGDGVVDEADVMLVTNSFTKGRPVSGSNFDFNNDGKIDKKDVALVKSELGKTCYKYALSVARGNYYDVTFNWTPATDADGLIMRVSDMTKSGKTSCSNINDLVGETYSPTLAKNATKWDYTMSIPGHKYCAAIVNGAAVLSNFVEFESTPLSCTVPQTLKRGESFKLTTSGFIAGTSFQVRLTSTTSASVDYAIGSYNLTLSEGPYSVPLGAPVGIYRVNMPVSSESTLFCTPDVVVT